MTQEGAAVCERREWPEEGEPTGIMQSVQPGQEQSSEQPAQHPYRKQEGLPRRDPMLPVRRKTATRHDHVHVRMMRHRGTPGVKNGGDADARTEMLRIGGDGQHRLGCRL